MFFFFFFLLPLEDPGTKEAEVLCNFYGAKKFKLTRSSFSAAIPKVAVTEKERLHFYPNRHIKAQNSVS